MNAALTVVKPGPLSSVQDLGRFGYRSLGVHPGGALDSLALRVANRLVGNDDDCAGLELTLGGCELNFEAATRIALCGDDFGARLDGRPLWPHWSLPVAAGQTLRLARTNTLSEKAGVRSWLAIAGGVDVPRVLGSRSTDLKAGFGGHRGRALKKNDRLPLGAPRWSERLCAGPAFGVRGPRWWYSAGQSNTDSDSEAGAGAGLTRLRVLPGPELARFSGAAQTMFWSTDWRITPQSNRMACRLDGPALKLVRPLELLSGAVLPGVIQVPPAGQPLVLLGDAQTVGGYPRIGVVIEADAWKLAQAPLQSKLRFVPVDIAAAQAARQVQQRYLDGVDQAVAAWKLTRQN
ncbi:MAG: biotin-dependent carboxyltransferase family protein [Variovorax sp.]